MKRNKAENNNDITENSIKNLTLTTIGLKNKFNEYESQYD